LADHCANHHGEAVRKLRQAIGLAADKVHVQHLLARMLAEQGRVAEALALYEVVSNAGGIRPDTHHIFTELSEKPVAHRDRLTLKANLWLPM